MTAEPVAKPSDAHPHGQEVLNPDEYKAVFRGHPAGVAVVSLRDDETGKLVGFTATSVISVSAAPPLLAFSLAASSSSWPALARTSTLALSFLADHQDDVSARFATSGIDRFAAGGWRALETGEPVIEGALSWVRGRVVQRVAVGSSFLVSVEAISSSVRLSTECAHREGLVAASPLVYHDRTYHRIGEHSAI
ncbi:flavin reductase family protein [Cellulomonas sp. HZM]|uniref:flavin reductase family protein n=1 Tax=Cellulomonas sp. HZM TaxID=1454010 RepID=UPI0004936990|nr:flavin reductase family protein [Cellulomonas sp. HZM]